MKHKYYLTGVILTAAALALSLILYPSLPDRIPTHWNIHGKIDGYGAKSWAAFLGSGLMALMLLTFRFLPWLSPHRFEVSFVLLIAALFIPVAHSLVYYKRLQRRGLA